MFFPVLLLTLTTGLGLGSCEQGEQHLPPIFAYDDLAQCHGQHRPAVYCYARTVLRTDSWPHGLSLPNPERTDRIISQYRRDLIESGICVSRCEEEVKKLTVAERHELLQPKFNVNFTYIYPSELFADLTLYKRRFETLTNICVNKRLRDAYGIMGFTELEYCRPREPANSTNDLLDAVFLFATIALLGCSSIATFLDLCGPSTCQNSTLVSSFSVRLNFRRLMEATGPGLHRKFQFIDGIKVLLNLTVIALHNFSVGGYLPHKNYTELEQLVSQTGNRIFFTACTYLVQTFLALGGFLLALHFVNDSHKRHIDRHYFVVKVLNRLVRLLPVYVLYLLLTVSWTRYLDTTVLGYRLFQLDHRVCRRYWWSNLLFVNNLPGVPELCSPYTWYLGADFQLFLAALGCLVVAYRKPRLSKILLSLTVSLAFGLPAYIIYRNNLHPVVSVKLSSMMFDGTYDSWIRKLYFPGYTNIGCYLAGVVAGCLYHRVTERKLVLRSFKLYRFLDAIAFPLVLLVTLPSFIFYSHSIPKPSVLIACLGSLNRNCIGVFVAIRLTKTFSTEADDGGPSVGLMRRFLSSKLLTTMGKLTYCSYICHAIILRYLYSDTRPNEDLDMAKIHGRTLYVFGLSYSVALLLYVLVEQPITTAFKRWISRYEMHHVKAHNKLTH